MRSHSVIVLAAIAAAVFAVSNSANAGEPPTAYAESPTTSVVLANPGDTIEFQIHGQDVDGDLRLAEVYLNGVFQTWAVYDGQQGVYDGVASWTYTFTTEGVYEVATVGLDLEGLYGGAVFWTVYVGDIPADSVEYLAEAVDDLGLAQGVENSLNAKLDAAYKKLTDGNDRNDVAAINELGAFINAVEAQRGKKIEEDDADDLIAAAEAIIAVL